MPGAAAAPPPGDRVVSPVWTVVMPLGIPQFAQGLTRRGLVYAALQAAGATASTVTGIAMWRAAEAGEVDTELTLRLLSAGCVAFTAGGWFASTVDAAHLRQAALDERRADLAPGPGRTPDLASTIAAAQPRAWRPEEPHRAR